MSKGNDDFGKTLVPSTPTAPTVPTPNKLDIKLPFQFAKVETIRDILENVKEPQLTSKQREDLLALQYSRNSKDLILSRERRDVLLEILGLIVDIGFEKTMSYLRSTTSPEDLLQNLPNLREEKGKLDVEATLLRQKERGIKGVGKCGKCGSGELVFVENQRRSADEPATVSVRCIQCGNKWHE